MYELHRELVMFVMENPPAIFDIVYVMAPLFPPAAYTCNWPPPHEQSPLIETFNPLVVTA